MRASNRQIRVKSLVYTTYSMGEFTLTKNPCTVLKVANSTLNHRNMTFYSNNIRSKVKKYSLLYNKKHKECNISIVLRYTKMPYPPKITNETKSDHNFLYPRERRQKNILVTIVDPLINTSLTEITVIFYNFFIILRPSRKPFRDITLYCKAAVSIELIEIISLVLKYIYLYHLILNIFLEITSKLICLYYFF